MALLRTTHDNGVVTYQSPLLRAAGVIHAFSTRIGGISEGPFSSLNLGNPANCESPDPQSNVLTNFERLQRAIGAAHMRRAWVTQVHGRQVELLEPEPENEYAETLDAELRDRFSGQTEADAIVSTVPNVLLTIRVADCVPILLAGVAAGDGQAVAAIHAGWRGVVGNVIAKTVRAMHEVGSPPAGLIAAIGPCISAAHFEVGDEVAEEFVRQGLAAAVVRSPAGGKKPHVDLQAAVRMQLETAGVQRIDDHGPEACTFSNPTDFYSHRRDHTYAGRMAALIAFRPLAS